MLNARYVDPWEDRVRHAQQVDRGTSPLECVDEVAFDGCEGEMEVGQELDGQGSFSFPAQIDDIFDEAGELLGQCMMLVEDQAMRAFLWRHRS
jgi:hypothetical protein